ncbi:MAG: hypothetical protein JXA21_06675 [Anaerolineae bacterium]|nr:hypothetical protein [Anaerolineae bacterium]
MSEEKPVEVENQEAPGCAEPTVFESIVKETVKVVESLGKALVNAAQNSVETLVVSVDAETLKQLDLLVKSGVASSRREAASALIREGIKEKGRLFDKIERTNAQIAELRKQLQSLGGAHN